MFTTPHRDLLLNIMDGVTYTAFTPYCGLITAITNWRTPTVTEASYTGYGTRPSISFGAPADTSPTGGRQKVNDAAVTFPQNTGSSQDMIGYGIYDAATAGNLKAIGLLDADPPIVGTCAATGEVITTGTAHGLATDQRIFALAAPGAAFPTGLSENTAYYVLAAGLTATAFTISASSGGAAVNFTTDGAGLFIPYTAVTVAASATPEFAIGTIIVQI
jgi:hypothetical protein